MSLRTLLPLALASLFVSGPVALGAGLNWTIASFDTEIVVAEDGELEITERIVADFSRERHRGIFRDIPFAYRRSGTEFELRLTVESVRNEAGDDHPFTARRRNGVLRIRVGDPEVWYQREVTYVIRYRVLRGLLSLGDHDELYWNATGDRWAVPMRRASCVVRLLEAIDSVDVRSASYLGPSGSTRAGPSGVVGSDGAVRFDVPHEIDSWNGLTVVVGFPKGHVAMPSAITHALWFVQDNWILGIPALLLVVLIRVWQRYGRDRGRARRIVVQYDPPAGMTPVEVGALIDERVHRRDVTASIIDLAVRGYLKIEDERESEFGVGKATEIYLERLNKGAEGLKSFEQDLLDGLFKNGERVSLDSLRSDFRSRYYSIMAGVHRSLVDEGYFNRGRLRWLAVAILGALGSVALLIFVLATQRFAPLTSVLAFVLTLPQFLALPKIMPQKTLQGRRALEHIKGLERYIERAELPTLDLAARRRHFEALLPHAMALNLSHLWAKKFDAIYERPPDWYAARSASGYTAATLVDHLDSTQVVMDRSIYTLPRTESSSGSWSSGGFGGGSSGFSGGSSGGGGGGGGGGAW